MPELTTVEKPKIAGFVDSKFKNANERRIAEAEAELEEISASEENAEVEEEKTEAVETKSKEPETGEERTYKKRYDDIRKLQSNTAEELKVLKAQLENAKEQGLVKPPKSDEDIQAWADKYPDVAAIVETIALKKAKEQSQDLEDKVQKINDLQESANRDKAEAQLMQLHPDFEEIRGSNDFHEWAEEQPSWVQNSLYENDTDAYSAARAIDLYKADRNLTGKVKSKSQDNSEAAKSVNTRASRSKPQAENTSGQIRESDVDQMSSQEYENNEKEIMEAIKTGKFIYDVSGSAR